MKRENTSLKYTVFIFGAHLLRRDSVFTLNMVLREHQNTLVLRIEARASNKMMLNGIPCRRTTRRDLQLLVDRVHVYVDGFGANPEVCCNLLVGQSSCQQAQHFNLTSGQSAKGR